MKPAFTPANLASDINFAGKKIDQKFLIPWMGRDEILFEPGRRVYFVEAFWVPFALQKGQGPLRQNLCLSDPDAQGRVSNPPLHKFRLDFWPRFLIKQKAGKEEVCLELCRPFALQKGQGISQFKKAMITN